MSSGLKWASGRRSIFRAILGRTGGKGLAEWSSGEGCWGRGGGEHPQERGASKRLYSDRTHTYIASSGRCWPAWLENPHQDGEGSDLPPIQFTPGLDLDASNKFEEEKHKMEELDSSVRGE